MFREPPRPQGPLPTAILWTATPAPTSTPAPTPTATAPPPTPSPSTDIGLGSRVRVSGTGNVGLNLRAGPGIAYERLDISQEGDVFIVVAGPVEGDDLIWWRLRDENNPVREGWAAANYLALQNE